MLLDWLSACVADDFCSSDDPDASGDDFSFFAVTQQQWRACVRQMLRCKLACALLPSSLLAFAVAEDENRDRFTRSLNSSESTGRAHLSYCPRLRETVQITIRDTKDCFQVYEVLQSRVTIQVIGPRVPPKLARTI